MHATGQIPAGQTLPCGGRRTRHAGVLVPVRRSGDPAELQDLSADEQKALETLGWFWQHAGAFNQLQSQQPETLAHGLEDSPAGLVGWNSQLLDAGLDDDFVLTHIAIYWFNRTAGSPSATTTTSSRGTSTT
ncbi:hypothetical protein [Flindersiella endophytica]